MAGFLIVVGAVAATLLAVAAVLDARAASDARRDAADAEALRVANGRADDFTEWERSLQGK